MFSLVPVIRHVRREGLHQAGEVEDLLPHLLGDDALGLVDHVQTDCKYVDREMTPPV